MQRLLSNVGFATNTLRSSHSNLTLHGFTLIGTLLLSCFTVPVKGMLANPLSFHEIQPDGSLTSPLFMRGDGKYNLITDDEGHLVSKDDDGWFVYFDKNSTRRLLRQEDEEKLANHSTLVSSSITLRRSHDMFSKWNISSFNLHRYDRQHQQRHLKKSSGIFRNLVLLVQFSDHNKRNNIPSRSDFDKLYNLLDTDPIIAPTGSVKRVYLENSYGAFTVESTVYRWISLSQTEAYYANGDNGFSKFNEAIIEALGVVENDPSINFTDFDMDHDGSIDGFGVLHSGYGAEFGGSDCYGQSNVNRIWSHKGKIFWTSLKDGIKVERYYVSSALRGTCGSDIVRMGVICHELGHYLGLPDLYDVTFKGNGIGAYDMMSQTWGFDGSGLYPPLFSAWSKVMVGWVILEVIDKDGTYEIESSATSNKVYRIDEGFREGEYILIENRQPIGYDLLLPHGGIAIWHIDEKSQAQNNRGYPDQNGWPQNGNHYSVALLPADGNYDLESGKNQGDSHDLWHSSSIMRGLTSGGTMYPRTDSYQGGLVTLTGIHLFGFSASKRIMTFSVKGFRTKKPTSYPTKRHSASSSELTTFSRPVTEPTTLHMTKAPFKTFFSNKPTTQYFSGSPVTQQDRCSNVCLEPVQKSECPSAPAIINCKFVIIGDLCNANGECSTDLSLNNCNGYGIYRRVECKIVTSSKVPFLAGDVTLKTYSAIEITSPTSKTPTSAPSQKTQAFIGAKFSSVSGHIWNDLDEEILQESNESGVRGVLIELLECTRSSLLEVTRTSHDGFYSFNTIQPGYYYLKIMVPVGYRFSSGHDWFQSEMAPNPCHEFLPEEGYSSIDAYLAIDSQPKHVSSLDEEDDALYLIENDGTSSLVHSKKSLSNKMAFSSANDESFQFSESKSRVKEQDSSDTQTYNSKSFLRGVKSSSSNSKVQH